MTIGIISACDQTSSFSEVRETSIHNKYFFNVLTKRIEPISSSDNIDITQTLSNPKDQLTEIIDQVNVLKRLESVIRSNDNNVSAGNETAKLPTANIFSSNISERPSRDVLPITNGHIPLVSSLISPQTQELRQLAQNDISHQLILNANRTNLNYYDNHQALKFTDYLHAAQTETSSISTTTITNGLFEDLLTFSTSEEGTTSSAILQPNLNPFNSYSQTNELNNDKLKIQHKFFKDPLQTVFILKLKSQNIDKDPFQLNFVNTRVPIPQQDQQPSTIPQQRLETTAENSQPKYIDMKVKMSMKAKEHDDQLIHIDGITLSKEEYEKLQKEQELLTQLLHASESYLNQINSNNDKDKFLNINMNNNTDILNMINNNNDLNGNGSFGNFVPCRQSLNFCMNDGTCIETNAERLCHCQLGFTGMYCQEETCLPNLCLNGGKHCGVSICETIDCGKGTCKSDGKNKPECQCDKGYILIRGKCSISDEIENIRQQIAQELSCPKNWYRVEGRCWYIENSLMNWWQARNYCTRIGGYLSYILTSKDVDIILAIMSHKDQLRQSNRIWVSAHDHFEHGSYEWDPRHHGFYPESGRLWCTSIRRMNQLSNKTSFHHDQTFSVLNINSNKHCTKIDRIFSLTREFFNDPKQLRSVPNLKEQTLHINSTVQYCLEPVECEQEILRFICEKKIQENMHCPGPEWTAILDQCIYFSVRKSSWLEARDFCAQKHSILFVLRTIDDWKWLQKMITFLLTDKQQAININGGYEGFHIGLSSIRNMSVYEWEGNRIYR
ncbi:unnamed protein product, partial [Didymodactylos carnosus]